MELLAVWHRVVALVRRRRLERDLDEELAFHLAMREADYREHGASETDARTAARRRFGSVAYLKEQCRDMWTFHPLETLIAGRALRAADAAQGARLHDRRGDGAGRRHRREHGHLQPLRRAAHPGASLHRSSGAGRPLGQRPAGQARAPRRFVPGLSRLARAGEERRRHGGVRRPHAARSRRTTKPSASPSSRCRRRTSRLLGVSAARGRTFSADEDLVAKPVQVAVLSDGLWKRRFGADPAMVGRTRHAERGRLQCDRRDAAGLQRPQRRRGAVGPVRRLGAGRRRWTAAAIAGSRRWRG